MPKKYEYLDQETVKALKSHARSEKARVERFRALAETASKNRAVYVGAALAASKTQKAQEVLAGINDDTTKKTARAAWKEFLETATTVYGWDVKTAAGKAARRQWASRIRKAMGFVPARKQESDKPIKSFRGAVHEYIESLISDSRFGNAPKWLQTAIRDLEAYCVDPRNNPLPDFVKKAEIESA